MDITIDNFPRAFVHRIHTKEGPVAGLRKVIIPQEDGNITVFMPKKCVRLKPNTTKCKLLFDSEKQIFAKNVLEKATEELKRLSNGKIRFPYVDENY